MYGSKKKPVKKYLVGGALAIPALTQGLMGLGQSIFGMSQASEAKKAIKEIQKNAPNIRIPTAIRELVNEPVAEELMREERLGLQRRTSSAIDALGRGGSRSLGLLPSVLENERMGVNLLTGKYEQARQNALQSYAQAQDTKLAREMDQYARDIDAARQSQMAGQQNIFGGLGQIGRGVTAIDWSGSKDGVTKENIAAPQRLTRSATGSEFLPTGDLINIPEDPLEELEEGEDVPDPFAWLSRIRFNKGGMLPKYKKGGDMPIKTEGEFNHNTNPKALIDEKTGEKQAELTGDEVILNKDQYKKMQKLAEEGKAEELLAYYKKLSAKFEKEKA